MGNDAGGVVDEADEEGFGGFAFEINVRSVQGVGLPHVVGVGFGEGEAHFATRVTPVHRRI